MFEFEMPADAVGEFGVALLSLKQSALRNELEIEQLAAPVGVAEKAIAFSANVQSEKSEISGNLGTGRFVLFWSAEPQENWTSNFRVVCFARSPLESDIGRETDSVDVTWDWLTEALTNSGAKQSALAGTTTRIISTGHGLMDQESEHAEIEIRASWSPLSTDIHSHFEAWQNLICVMSGFSIAPGVNKIPFGA